MGCGPGFRPNETSNICGQVSSVKTLVFDLGNVVAWFSHEKAARQLAKFGPKPDCEITIKALQSHCFGSPLDHSFERGHLEKDHFRSQVKAPFGLNLADEEFDHAFSDIFEPNPKTHAILDKIHLNPGRPKLWLLSNTTPLHIEHIKKHHPEWLRWFDRLALSFELGYRKPEPGLYDQLCKDSGGDPSKILLVDDLPANCEGARERGWRAVCYQPHTDLLGELAALGW